MADEIWQKYFRTKDEDSRDALIREYLPLVKQIAGRLAMGLPPNIEEEELAACGVIGLLEAMERYNPYSEASFKTFATWRIRGAMLDELRKSAWMPRSTYQRLRQVRNAEQKISHRLGREPTASELATELNWSPEAVEQVYAQMNCYTLLSLESLLFAPSTADSESGEELLLTKGYHTMPEETLEIDEQREMLASAIEKLSEREKTVLALYYKEELTLREIGQILNVTAARISQIHARCILNLREEMQKAGYLKS
ncbi:MAG: FliA/WhiG family RNA polymerase sigma factor [Firmicutes bacterium]|nr:FliA/WhiG family RNA polymerase sigma factor [Bacillota bacterium]